MRHSHIYIAALLGSLTLSACGNDDARVQEALRDVNVIDESNLNELMLTVGDPEESVTYFRRTSNANPDRIDLKRGLAQSLVRANKTSEGIRIWREVTASPEGTNDDRVALAGALIRNNDWADAATELNQIPPTYETFERYRYEAMVADSKKDWAKADSFYEVATGLTTTPAGVLNNWGFSKLTRGDPKGAEKLFNEALKYDSKMFTAKNNLVLARATQGNYDLPVVDMTQTERAELLYTAALAAIKKGDTSVGKRLLQQAVDTHPQFFEAASRSLEALGG
jgi:tetratricopeptide (TPR) repeat protein